MYKFTLARLSKHRVVVIYESAACQPCCFFRLGTLLFWTITVRVILLEFLLQNSCVCSGGFAMYMLGVPGVI